MPMPPPTRIAPAASGRELARLREGVAERAVDPDPLARLELAEPVGPGPDPLDQEVEPDAAVAGSASATEKAPAAGTGARLPAPSGARVASM